MPNSASSRTPAASLRERHRVRADDDAGREVAEHRRQAQQGGRQRRRRRPRPGTAAQFERRGHSGGWPAARGRREPRIGRSYWTPSPITVPASSFLRRRARARSWRARRSTSRRARSMALKARQGEGFVAALRGDARVPRPRRRDGHGQVRPRRPQDRRDARLDRHAGVFRASRRGEPWRPRHGDRGRRRGSRSRTRARATRCAIVRRQADPALKIIAMTGLADSSLGRHADIVLSSAVDQEACPLNLAPTASTTAKLALGDALAMALLEAGDFARRTSRAPPRGQRSAAGC